MFGTCSPEFLTVKAAWNAVGVYDVSGEKQYCDIIKEDDLNSKDQITIAGYVSSINANCSAQIITATGQVLTSTASNDIIIKTDTVITEGANVILQIDPCAW